MSDDDDFDPASDDDDGEAWSDALRARCMEWVGSARHEPGLVRLFQGPAGAWQAADQLWPGGAAGKDDADDAATRTRLMVTWIAAPVPNDGSYAVVLFYDFAEIWEFAAYYNRAGLLRRHGQTPG